MKQAIVIICAGVLTTAPAAAQLRARRDAGEKRTVGVAIALKAGAEQYQFKGQASCTHAPIASIHNVVAEQWTVEQSEGSRSSHLTLWKPKNGSGEMFSLSLSTGSHSRRVNTVTAPGAPAASGSGKVSLASAASGGTFTIDAKAADGTAIAGTIVCDAFLPAIAEGGN